MNKPRPKSRRAKESAAPAIAKTLAVLLFVLGATNAPAQMPNPYGAPITLENAKKAAAAALAEARKNNWTMAAAITGSLSDTDTTMLPSPSSTPSTFLKYRFITSSMQYPRRLSNP